MQVMLMLQAWLEAKPNRENSSARQLNFSGPQEVFHGFPASEFDMAEHIPQKWVACSARKTISTGRGLSDTPYYQPMLLGEGSTR